MDVHGSSPAYQPAGVLLLSNARRAPRGFLDRADGGLGQLRGQPEKSQQASTERVLGRADRRRDGPRRDPVHVRGRDGRSAALTSGPREATRLRSDARLGVLDAKGSVDNITTVLSAWPASAEGPPWSPAAHLLLHYV